MDRIVAYENKPNIVTKAVFLNNENCKYLFNICSKRVELSENRIAGISDNPLVTLMGQCMEYFDISSNRIEFINPWYMVDLVTRYPNLQVINISSNEDHCNCETSWVRNHPQNSALMTNNEEINEFPFNGFVSNMFFTNISTMIHFKKRGVITFKISETITVLQLSKNYLHPLNALPRFNLRLSINAKNLKELHLVHTTLSCETLAPIEAPSLEIIDISNNDCSIIKRNIFIFALKLRIFWASNSNLRFASSFEHGTLFRGLKELRKVDVSRNSITYLPPTMFEDQENSLSTVNFDSNLFSTIPVSNLKNLTHLYIRQNKISFFTRNDIEKIMSMKKAIIFIEGNPISCECTHIRSLKWMKENQDKFGDLNKTLCINKNVLLSTFVHQEVFKKFELMCQSDAWLIGSTFALFFVLTILLTTAVVKRYRVHVDYVILRLRSRWKGVIHVSNSDEFRFDAFVTYTEEDYQLACITFYQALTRLGFKISIPDKDFLPGISEAEQLLQCIDQSHKVVIIVTENFLENGWNSYAVQMVVTHAFHNKRERSIIVIIKDDIPIERLPRDLKYIWWTIVSLRWPNGIENMDLFWEEIAAAILT